MPKQQGLSTSSLAYLATHCRTPREVKTMVTLQGFTPAELAKMKPENRARVVKAFDMRSESGTRWKLANMYRATARAIGRPYDKSKMHEIGVAFDETWNSGRAFVDPVAAAKAWTTYLELAKSGAAACIDKDGEYVGPKPGETFDVDQFLREQATASAAVGGGR
jgi:hypothetical protein